MASLLVRGLDDALVQRLREQAAAHGRSTEAEHRLILNAALLRPQKLSFAEVLFRMPNVGLDSDFERPKETDDKGPARVFDWHQRHQRNTQR